MAAESELDIIIRMQDEATQKIAGLEGQLNEMSGASQNAGISVGQMAAAVALGEAAFETAKAAVEAFANAVKGLTETADTIEHNRIALEAMVGSAADANQIMQQLNEFTKTAPFDMPQLSDGAKRLATYGVQVGQIVPDMESLATIAEVVGKDNLPQLVDAFGMVKDAGSISTQQLRLFRTAGMDVVQMLVDANNSGAVNLGGVATASSAANEKVQKLSDSLAVYRQKLDEAEASGKAHASTITELNNKISETETKLQAATAASSGFAQVTNAQVNDMIKKGTISFDDLSAAIQASTEQGGRFGNIIAAESLTAGDRITKLQERVRNLALEVLGLNDSGEVVAGGFFDKVSQAAGQLMDWFDKNREAIKQVATEIAVNLVNGLESLGATIIKITTFFAEHRTELTAVIAGVAAFTVALVGVGVVALIAANAVPLAIFAVIGLLAALAVEVQGHWDKVKAAFEVAKDWLVNIAKDIGVVLFILLTGPLGLALLLIVQNWEEIKQTVSTATATVVSSVKAMWDSLVVAFQAGVTTATTWFKNLPDSIAYQLGLLVGRLIYFTTTELPQFAEATVTWFAGLPGRTAQALQLLWQSVSDWFVRSRDTAITAATDLANTVSTTLAALPGRIATALTNLWNQGKSAFDQFKQQAVQWADDTVNSIVTFFAGLPKKISDSVTSGVNQAGNFLSGLGQSFLKGLGAGIEGRAVGGPVSSGTPYVVGERGPELFVPGTSGSIVPSNRMPSMGGATITINMNGNVVVDNDQRVSQLASQVAALIGRQNLLASNNAY
jgi:hypothetical protein